MSKKYIRICAPVHLCICAHSPARTHPRSLTRAQSPALTRSHSPALTHPHAVTRYACTHACTHTCTHACTYACTHDAPARPHIRAPAHPRSNLIIHQPTHAPKHSAHK